MNHPNFPVTRHFQRYEYVMDQGYVDDKIVLDIGCGYGACTGMMVYFAKAIVGIDPCLKDNEDIRLATYSFPGKTPGTIHFYAVPWEKIDRKKSRFDVIVAMELIEHLHNSEEFLDFAAEVGEYLFLSTPLAKETAPTDNILHVVEYSSKDLADMVSKKFDIIKTVYQTGDMRIVDEAEYKGSSIDINHIVQMLWCKRKGEAR